jgi:hypothetical protein
MRILGLTSPVMGLTAMAVLEMTLICAVDAGPSTLPCT